MSGPKLGFLFALYAVCIISLLASTSNAQNQTQPATTDPSEGLSLSLSPLN